MKHFLLALLVPLMIALWPAPARSQHNHQSHMTAAPSAVIHTAGGEIKSIDAAHDRLELSHEAIPALSWPAMTMYFKVGDKSLFEGLKPGDKVRFDFQAEGDSYLIVDIEPRP